MDIFYEKWKLKVQENPRVAGAIAQLLGETYGKGKGIWEHPYGRFNASCVRNYVDRAGFRLGNR